MPKFSCTLKWKKLLGSRNSAKLVLVGGTPMTDDFCKRIKADAWGADCGDAIKKARMLVGKL